MSRLDGRFVVPTEKLTHYLLDPTSRSGGAGKAAFFSRFGFQRFSPDPLIAALLAHAEENDVIKERADEFGLRKTVVCNLRTPDGRNPCVNSVWQRDVGAADWRFITAFPA